MRQQVLTLALMLGVVASASAQGQGEVIIRRPGEPDRVIHLDSANVRADLLKVEGQLREMATSMQPRIKQLQEKLQLDLESARTRTLALKEAETGTDYLMPLLKTFSTSARRQPHLGVQISVEPRETDKFGASIIGVTPGSPAEKAGILSGDVITRIGGKSLATTGAKEESNPGLRLISIIATLPTGKPVEVVLRRGTQTVTVKVTPVDEVASGTIARMAPNLTEIQRLPGDRFGEALSLRTMPATPQYNVFANGNGSVAYTFGTNGLFANIELTALNEKLGSYFGTTEGVLVVNIGADRFSGEMGSVFFSNPASPRDVVNRKIQTDTAHTMARGGIAARTGRDSVMIRIDSTTRGAARAGRLEANTAYIDGAPMTRRTPFTMGLEPGDVITAVDGRKVTNPSQLMRIVGTYEHNDEFKLQILRQKRPETLTVKMP